MVRSLSPLPPTPPRQGSFFGKVVGYGAAAIALGVLAALAWDFHGHTCDLCGAKWKHLGAWNVGDEEAHTCPKCGARQWWKDGAPRLSQLYSDAGLFTRMPEGLVASPPPSAATKETTG